MTNDLAMGVLARSLSGSYCRGNDKPYRPTDPEPTRVVGLLNAGMNVVIAGMTGHQHPYDLIVMNSAQCRALEK